MERRHDHHFARADDVGQRRIHFRMHVFEIDVEYRVPGFLQIDECLVQHHAHHTQLGGREFAALDLCMAPVTAKEVIHQLEHQFGVEDEQ